MNGLRKEVERGYLERFLELTRQRVRIIDSERPDFILVSGVVRTGIEVTRVARLGDATGVAVQSDDRAPHRALAGLARRYYAAGGLPLMLETSSAIGAEGPLGAALVERLVAARTAMRVNETLSLSMDHEHESGPLHLRALPESFGEFSRWTYKGDRDDRGRVLGLAVLEAAVLRKARHLPHYRLGVGSVQLLLVADRLQDSVRWQPPRPFAQLPRHGFDAVHLLLHPGEVHTVG